MRTRPLALGVLAATLVLDCGGRTGLATGRGTGECADAPAVPTLLTEVGVWGQYPRVTSMTVLGSMLYYAVNDGSNNPLALRRVPLAGGAPEDLVAGNGGCDSKSPFGYGTLENDGRHVYTTDEESIGCSGYARHVTVFDAATDDLSSLENPPGAAVDPIVVSPRALPGGGVAWLARSRGLEAGSLVAWDGAGAPRVVAPVPAIAVGLLVVGGDAFANWIQNGQATVERIDLATGVTKSSATFVAKDFRFVGSNDDSIFYTTDGKTLTRQSVASLATNTVDADLAGALWFTHDTVYFVRESQPPDYAARLFRAPVLGGPAAEWYRDYTRNQIQAIDGDSCRLAVAVGLDSVSQRPVAILEIPTPPPR